MPKRAPIETDPKQKGATRKRVGVSKTTGKIPAAALNKDIAKQKKAVKAAKHKSAKRAAAVKKLRQDNFAKVFGKKRGKKL